MALVSFGACERAEVTSPAVVPSHDDVYYCSFDRYPSDCGSSITFVAGKDGVIGTGTIGVLLYGSPQINVSKFTGATKVQLVVNGSTKPVTYNEGSVVSFVEHYGWYRLNMTLASFTSDTIHTSPPPPPPPTLRTAMFRDFNGDGYSDAVFFFPVADLVKGGLKVGSNNIQLSAFGAGISSRVDGSTVGMASDSIHVAPPPPPPTGK
jgi:hypothetical protein